MEVILLERVVKLGNVGDVVTVKSGYARNYLIPNTKCLRATEANKKIFEEQKAQIEANNLAKKSEAESLLKTIENKEVIMVRKAGESGHLYGSVKTSDIVAILAEEKINIDKKQVSILSPIKALGIADIAIHLHPEVSTHILLNVARGIDEAALQMKDYLNAKTKKESGQTEDEIATAAYLAQNAALKASEADLENLDDLEGLEEFKEEIKE